MAKAKSSRRRAGGSRKRPARSIEKRRKLSTKQLRWKCPSSFLPFKSTEHLEPPKGTVGQQRALRALGFGLEIRKKGYNIVAVGLPGTGKTSSVERLLRHRAAREKNPGDICYVHNFDDAQRPKALVLPPGNGRLLASQMEQLVDDLHRRVPRILSSRLLANQRAKITADFRSQVEQARRELMSTAREHGLKVDEYEDRLLIAPLVEGEPIGPEDFDSMPPEVKQVLEERVLTFQQRMANFERAKGKMEREVEERIVAQERSAIEPYVEDLLSEIKDAHDDGRDLIEAYLAKVHTFVLENHRRFLGQEEQPGEEGGEGQEPSVDIDPHPDAARGEDIAELVELQVNVLVYRDDGSGAPVVVERHPTRQNLLGFLEYRDQHGALQTDHTLIRPGALHRANGGYLMLQAAELDQEANAWEALRRALDHQEVRVDENREEGQRLAGSVDPESIPLDAKVILIGTGDAVSSFQDDDLDFERLFKVKADFEESFPRTKANVEQLARFMGQVAREEKLRSLSRAGAARMVEYCCREAENQKRLSARLALVVDLIAEADYWARRSRRKRIEPDHIDRALAARLERHSKLEDQILEDIRQGQLLIDTQGSVVGQINGIAIYDMGDHIFGVPSRITARAYAGRQGVVNIDREVKLSGAIHDKGALILVGYLGGRFALSHGLALSASITFEQSYEEVEGDSASATELFALLSCLADVPIRQAIAATGSVNQQGELQAIGGVNEKIEGVFRLCRTRGLTGEQGVIIPNSNVGQLMLRKEVIDAVRSRRFHIWAVRDVDEGMEILTGFAAGKLRKDGTWTPGSINDRVARRLAAFSRMVEKPGRVDPDDTK